MKVGSGAAQQLSA